MYNVYIGIETMNEEETISVCIGVKAGSIHEPARVSGISHLLEHLLFKSRGCELTDRLQAIGCSFNAITSKDFTLFFLYCKSQYYTEAIHIAHDIVFAFDVGPQELEVEKKIVLQEKEDICNRDFEKFQSLFYKYSHFSNSVIGTDKSISNITLSDLKDYHSTNYHPTTSAIVISCPKTIIKDALSVAKKRFDISVTQFLSSRSVERKEFMRPHAKRPAKRNPKTGIPSSLLFTKSPLNTGEGITIMFSGPAYSVENDIILTFLQYALTGELWGAWIKRIREVENAAYAVLFKFDLYEDFGEIMIACSHSLQLPCLELFDVIRQCITSTPLIFSDEASFLELQKKFKDYYKAKLASLPQWKRAMFSCICSLYNPYDADIESEKHSDQVLDSVVSQDKCMRMVDDIFMRSPVGVMITDDTDTQISPRKFRSKAADVFSRFPSISSYQVININN